MLIIILNWNSPSETITCLDSAFRLDYPIFHVIVVDNGSTDDSIAQIHAAHPTVEILKIDQNKGYAGGNNHGIEQCLHNNYDYVWVLNNDTYFEPNLLSVLINEIARSNNIAAISPIIYHADEPNVIQCAGVYFDERLNTFIIGQNQDDIGQFSQPFLVDAISGCCMLINIRAIRDIGAFDEKYFLYWEEIDWCYRAIKGNWKILTVPGAKLWHKGVSINYQPSAITTYYITRNRLYFLNKNTMNLKFLVYECLNNFRIFMAWLIKKEYRLEKKHHRTAIIIAMADYLKGVMGKKELFRGNNG